MAAPFNQNGSVPVALSCLPEIEQIIRKLEHGTSLIKFYQKGRPEKRTFSIKLETRQVIWWRPVTGRTVEEGAVDLREVKEVRLGRNSKIFDRWPEDARKWDPAQCFVIFYGSAFRLKTLSCVATSAKDCEQWIHGIRYLVADTLSASYPLQVERWLRKEFYSMQNPRNVITLKDLKAFFPKVNCKLSTNKLKEYFQEVDTNRAGEIGFEGFASLYHSLIHDEKLFNDFFKSYADESGKVTLKAFQKFLSQEQKDTVFDDERVVSKFMRDYLQDPLRDAQEPYFTVPEVCQSNRMKFYFQQLQYTLLESCHY